MVGVPVIINHKDLTADNADDERVGVVSRVWYDEKDGWYWCEGVIWDETAQNLITDKGWSVSCSYDVKLADDAGGTENNIKYDMEFLDGVFTHLAIVENPRYERANIVFNSKTEILNSFEGHKGRKGLVGGSLPRGVVDLTNYFTEKPTLSDVKSFLDEAVKQGKEFVTQSPDWLVDIPDSSKKKDHIAKSSQFSFMNKSEKNRHNKYVMALEDLLKEAKYLNDAPNTKLDKKPNTEKYHYFESIAKIGTNQYKVIFDTEQYFGDDTTKPQTVHLYDIHEIKSSPSSANVLPSVKNLKEELTNSINDNSENFNPTEQEMLNNVDNWNEADHPRDEAGRFTEKGNDKFNNLISKSYVQEHLLKSAKAQQYENKEAKIGDTIIDSDRLLSLFVDDLTPEEYKSFDWDEAEDALFEELEKIEKSLGFKTKIDNAKEQEMALIEELKKLITKVENDKGEDMDHKEKVENEKVDKRKLIDEVGGILKGKVDEEVWRTIIGKIEKIGYNESEKGTADNKKVKNETEEDKKEVKELKEEMKKDVENKKKCDNSVDNAKPSYFDKMNEIYNSAIAPKEENVYISKDDRLKAAEEYFA